jgi:phosphatidylglycerol lysyltransferase
VTRRRDGAPNGAMEIIFAESFEKMGAEGVVWGNLGLCPLANIDSEDKSLTNQLFQFIYENMNGVYGFKGLYQAKKKWAPSDWQARYIAYAPKPFGPSYAYAMLKAQNPKGINKLILEKLRIFRNDKEK